MLLSSMKRDAVMKKIYGISSILFLAFFIYIIITYVHNGGKRVYSQTSNVKINRNKMKTNYHISEQFTNNSFISLPPRGSQMSENQIKVIKRVLPEQGNLLIWGLGYDSQFWHYSTSGRVTFIEDDTPSKKAGKITHDFPFLETYRVHYRTRILESFDKYIDSPDKWHELDLSFQLPRSVALEHWHVIVVDAPVGCYRKGPGRYQSIYTSAILAREGTHIFVDDFERKVEHEFSKRVLGKPIEVVHRLTTGNSTTKQQAHFVRSSSYVKYLKKRVHRG